MPKTQEWGQVQGSYFLFLAKIEHRYIHLQDKESHESVKI